MVLPKFAQIRVFFAVGTVFLVGGCRSAPEDAVAHIGSYNITVTDFKSRLQDTPAAYQQYTATSEGRRQFLNLLVREKVLLVEAKKAGLQREENYKKAIDQFKTKWERNLKDYEESLLVEMYLARLRNKDITVTDAEIRDYYAKHEAEFARPVEIQASHILVNSDMAAQQVLERLRAGDSFENLARQVSIDPATAARGGKLAPFTKGALLAEFERAVMPLKPGQVSGVVKTSFGYHIIKKTAERALPAQSLDDAKAEIQNRIQREKFDQWVTTAQSSLGVRIDEKALASLSISPAAARPSAQPSREGVGVGGGSSNEHVE